MRKGLIGSLVVLYTTLTLTALNCGLTHAFAAMDEACAMGMRAQAAPAPMAAGAEMGARMGAATDTTPVGIYDAHFVRALCQCLDELAAHGPVVVALGLPEAGATPLIAAPYRSVALPIPAGPDTPRGPPVSA